VHIASYRLILLFQATINPWRFYDFSSSSEFFAHRSSLDDIFPLSRSGSRVKRLAASVKSSLSGKEPPSGVNCGVTFVLPPSLSSSHIEKCCTEDGLRFVSRGIELDSSICSTAPSHTFIVTKTELPPSACTTMTSSPLIPGLAGQNSSVCGGPDHSSTTGSSPILHVSG